MWEYILKHVPPPLLLGVLIYSLVTFLWLQPLVERRAAALIFIPQCERGDLPAVPVRSDDPETRLTLPGGTSVAVPPVEPPLGVQIVSGVKSLFYGDDNPYSVPPGLGDSPCACAVSMAYDSIFWRSHVHVMSLRTYTPNAIENFDGRVAQMLASGLCGTVKPSHEEQEMNP